jgi:tetratricopeptide (TPR) repeat protein
VFRIVLAAMALVAVVGAATFVAKVGNPVTWANDRYDEFKNEGQPDLRNRSTRYTFNVGSGRYDIWRVALDEARDEPLLGTGGGGFQYAYMQKRKSGADLRDAHSIELENLSELGIPGLALLLAAIGGAFVGAWRSCRAGPGPAALSAAAIATGTYWVVHSSVDWFWAYPSISGATLALLGAACAPAALAVRAPRRRLWRPAAVVAAGVLAISAVPPMLSEFYVNAAYEGWKADLSRAYQDLDRARSLNPLSEEPLLAEGAIAKAAGERSRALSAFEEAAAKRPEEWAAHYYVAALSADDDRALARREIRTALNLDPNTFAVRKLARRLDVKPPPLSYEP